MTEGNWLWAVVSSCIVETFERNICIIWGVTVFFSVPKVLSKVYTKNIVNIHFRYQLWKVGYRVCIFYFAPIYATNMFLIWKNVNSILQHSIDIKPIEIDIAWVMQPFYCIWNEISGAFLNSQWILEKGTAFLFSDSINFADWLEWICWHYELLPNCKYHDFWIVCFSDLC